MANTQVKKHKCPSISRVYLPGFLKDCLGSKIMGQKCGPLMVHEDVLEKPKLSWLIFRKLEKNSSQDSKLGREPTYQWKLRVVQWRAKTGTNTSITPLSSLNWFIGGHWPGDYVQMKHSGSRMLFGQRPQRADVLYDTGVNFHPSICSYISPSLLWSF